MREVNAAAQAQRAKREGLLEIPMIWVAAKNRDTGVVEGLGLWGGEDTEIITVRDLFTGANVARTFHSGGLLEVGTVRWEVGLAIRPVTIRLSSISDAVLVAFRQYEPRGAEVQMWKRCYDPATRVPITTERWFKGYVNTAPSERPAPEGEAAIEVDVVSTARTLTITSALKKSNAAQKRRGIGGAATPDGDMIRRYKTTAAQWDVPWGTEE